MFMVSLTENNEFGQNFKIIRISLIKNTEFGQNLKITVISLIEKYRILTKCQNGYDILN